MILDDIQVQQSSPPERLNNSIKNIIWALGLQGVVVCLANRKSDGFNSHKVHEEEVMKKIGKVFLLEKASQGSKVRFKLQVV